MSFSIITLRSWFSRLFYIHKIFAYQHFLLDQKLGLSFLFLLYCIRYGNHLSFVSYFTYIASNLKNVSAKQSVWKICFEVLDFLVHLRFKSLTLAIIIRSLCFFHIRFLKTFCFQQKSKYRILCFYFCSIFSSLLIIFKFAKLNFFKDF